MEKQLSVDKLTLGMFVSALDRPWLDTPFLVQGFLIEDEETLAQLRQICRKVTVDLRRSAVNDAEYQPPPHKRPEPVEPKVGRISSPPPPLKKRPRSLFPRWLKEAFAGRGYVAPEKVDEAPTLKHLLRRDSQTSAEGANRLAVRKFEDVDPSLTAVKPKQGLALPRKDLLAWLSEQLERVRFSAPEEPSAEASDTQASRLKRAHGATVYHNVPLEQELQSADESYGNAIDMIGSVMRDIRVGKGLEIEAVESVVEDLVESIIRHPGALQLVSRMREADESSYTHALQVAVLLASFGRELGFSREQLTYLGQVGMLLDVGKLRIDERILNKRGNLTPAEFEEVKRHVQYGLEIVESSGVAHPDVVSGVAEHHERLNASGYPRGLHDAQIAPVGKMAGIVDSFSALTSVRPYAQPVSAYTAMQQLQGWAGTYFNPGLVELFIQSIGIFPVGTLVELSTGECAVVLEQGRGRRLKPKVLVVSAPDKKPLEIPFVLDLLHSEGAPADGVPYIRQGLPTASFAVDTTEYYVSRS
ncbi:MAG TPA: HD-GYP domain-containing protein [Burkholderiales bacterium]|nr:HD-GYP domain-containing protein [Burkholderiales bacterium]